MSIPQAQLATWANQGTITGSAATYASIKRALEAKSASYSNRNFKIFLQGSYGNDTNIYAESDVDVVICCDDGFFHDLNSLTESQKRAFQVYFKDSPYSYDYFKGHVEDALRVSFGNSVDPGNKAIKVKPNGSRRSSDVVVAFEFRRYDKFNGLTDYNYDSGICFFAQDGTMIINYPKQHSENLTTKHQATGSNFKPIVRIFKNMRTYLIENGIIAKGTAPSYYVESLIYNVPNDKFQGSYTDIVFNILKWLHETTDKTNLVCANKQYYLLRNGHPTCWPTADGVAFIQAVVDLWINW